LDYFALIERMGFELTVNDFSGLIVSDETQDARALLGVAGSELLRLYEGLEAQKGSLVVPEAARLSRERRLCLHAAEYLRRHLTLPVTAGEVASACHVSVSTLSHVFKRTIALSLRAYLLRFRLEAAKELLRAGRSVTDAALEAGFDDPNYFSRAFAQAEGVPPSRWNSGGNG
jgi:AraC-like DNA-binding protein